MRRIWITSPDFRPGLALLHALQTLPHPDTNIALADWGVESPRDYSPERDRWIVLATRAEQSVEYVLPENARIVTRLETEADLLALVVYAGLTGPRCKLDEMLATWKAETREDAE